MFGIKLHLPSRGHYGKAFVNIRRPKLEDLIEYFQLGNNSIVAKNQLLKVICDTDLSKYPIGDREYVFTNVRSLVNSNIITGVIECKCNEKESETVPYILDLSRCRVYQLPDDFVSNFELVFPICKEKKIINLLTVEKEELLEDYVNFYEAADIPLVNSDLGENLYEFAKYGCMFSDSVDIVTLDNNVTFLRELDWSDFELLLLYDVSFECGPDVVCETICDKCGKKYRVRIKTDSSFFGLSLEGLINRHRFLAKASNIGFTDFLKYTVPVMHTVTEAEVQRVKEQNAKIKASRGR